MTPIAKEFKQENKREGFERSWLPLRPSNVSMVINDSD